MKNLWFYDFPIGKIGIVEKDNKISNIFFAEENINLGTDTKKIESELIKLAYKQLDEYFNKKRKEFDLPLLINGTKFQVDVWNALTQIPYGSTCSYKDIAEKVGSPKAYRAVGLTNNRNPLCIVIPCHRVIGSNGSMVGYAYGIESKRYLLELEKTITPKY